MTARFLAYKMQNITYSLAVVVFHHFALFHIRSDLHKAIFFFGSVYCYICSYDPMRRFGLVQRVIIPPRTRDVNY